MEMEGRYGALEKQMRQLNSAVESMAYNVECLAGANGALVNLSENMGSFLAATSAGACVCVKSV